jgi:hypothetical protein
MACGARREHDVRQRADGARIRKVDVNGGGCPSARGDAFDGGARGASGYVTQHYSGSFGTEPARRCGANAGRAADYYRNLAAARLDTMIAQTLQMMRCDLSSKSMEVINALLRQQRTESNHPLRPERV